MGRPRRTRSEVKDGLEGAQLALGGRDEESRVRRKAHQGRHHGSNEDSFPQETTQGKSASAKLLILPEDIRRKAIAPSKKRRRTPARNPASPNASQDSGRAAPPSLPCWRSALE